MLNESEKDWVESQVEELQKFILHTKDIREWKRGQAVKLRFQGFSYREIEKRLEVSTSFIAQTQSKYLSLGIAGLKLKYQGSKSYLTTEQLSSTIQWLSRLENRNISELERYLMTNYDVVFKSRESYYRILKAGQLSWQKANVENSRKQPDIIKKKLDNCRAFIPTQTRNRSRRAGGVCLR